MRRLPWLVLVPATLSLMATPALAEVQQPLNALGFGAGETTGIGLLYQRVLGSGWHGRGSLGAIPTFNPYSDTLVFAGTGIQRDIAAIGGLRSYALLGGLYKKVASNSYHLSVDPGLGVQWGPVLIEVGTSFWRSYRWNDDGIPRYIEWGLSLAVGCGMLWAF